MCYVMIGNVNASSSCEPRMSFLGFSQDWKTVYWEEQKAGECVENFLIHAYDITSDSPFYLFSQERIDKIIDFDDDLFSEENEIDDEELERIRKKHYANMKLALGKILILPIEGRWIDKSASITGSKLTVRKKCDQRYDPDAYPKNCNFTISCQNKRCNEQLVYQDMERYLYPMKDVKSVHHNSECDVVVLISEHCNSTDPLCHPNNAIQIIKLTGC